jgi:hypothetical protein
MMDPFLIKSVMQESNRSPFSLQAQFWRGERRTILRRLAGAGLMVVGALLILAFP